MTHRPSATLVALTSAALLLPVPAAHAATAAPLKRCFLSVAPDRTEPVPVESGGFTPHAPVEVRLDGDPQAVVTADGRGRVRGTLPAPYVARRERSFEVELVERGDPGNSVRLRSRVTALSVDVRPRTARPDKRVRFVGRGFTGDGPVYAHYVLDGEESRTIRLARPRGACGRFSARRRQFPFRPSVGAWIVQVDQQPEFEVTPNSPFVRLPITVRWASRKR